MLDVIKIYLQDDMQGDLQVFNLSGAKAPFYVY